MPSQRALRRFGEAPEGLFGLLIGGRDVGEALVDDHRVAVVSATGSTAMGRAVGPRLAARFARAILELGGNNAAIVAPSAVLDLAVRAIAFAAMGTTGQRCTTLRRLFVHDSVYDAFVRRLSKVYTSAKVGDPREAGILVGPLIDGHAFERREAEKFLSTTGSDCGIANVNIGPSGAEIGGAFGGEKETGGGREAGSDAWKAYMRRATNTINFGSQLPLAQGVRFDIEE